MQKNILKAIQRCRGNAGNNFDILITPAYRVLYCSGEPCVRSFDQNNLLCWREHKVRSYGCHQNTHFQPDNYKMILNRVFSTFGERTVHGG